MIEQIKNVASEAVGALKATPLMLGLLILNIIFFVAIYFAVRENREHQDKQMQLILDRCLPAK